MFDISMIRLYDCSLWGQLNNQNLGIVAQEGLAPVQHSQFCHSSGTVWFLSLVLGGGPDTAALHVIEVGMQCRRFWQLPVCQVADICFRPLCSSGQAHKGVGTLTAASMGGGGWVSTAGGMWHALLLTSLCLVYSGDHRSAAIAVCLLCVDSVGPVLVLSGCEPVYASTEEESS